MAVRSIDSRIVALKNAAPNVVHRPDGMGLDEFVPLMLTSLTPEAMANGESRKWLEAMTHEELVFFCAELEESLDQSGTTARATQPREPESKEHSDDH